MNRLTWHRRSSVRDLQNEWFTMHIMDLHPSSAQSFLNRHIYKRRTFDPEFLPPYVCHLLKIFITRSERECNANKGPFIHFGSLLSADQGTVYNMGVSFAEFCCHAHIDSKERSTTNQYKIKRIQFNTMAVGHSSK